MKSNNQDEESFKKQREVFTQNIRKEKRQQKFSKKRNFTQAQIQNSNGLIVVQDTVGTSNQKKNNKKILIVDEERREIIDKFISQTYSVSDFPKLVVLLYSSDIVDKHHGIIGIRKIMSFDNSPHIYLLVNNNLVPYLMEYVYQNIYPQLQLQAAWILTNVASGPTQYCKVLVENNGIPTFIKLIKQNKPGVVDQAIWAIGNIAGDCPAFRDLLVKEGVLLPLIQVMNQTNSKNNVKQGAWALSNLCRGSPLPKYEDVKQAVIPMCKVIKTKILDTDGLADCLWAISYMTQGPKIRLLPLFQQGVIQALVQFARGKLVMTVVPALRILGNVSVGNQKQTDELIKYGIFDLIQELFDSPRINIRSQVCWILSNIAAGTRPQVDQILKRKSLVQKTVNLFQIDSLNVKKQICYVFSNMVHLGDTQKVYQFVTTNNILSLYADIIINQKNNHKLLATCLETLSMLLQLGDKLKAKTGIKNILINELIKVPRMVQTLQSLQYHQSNLVYKALHDLLVKHFDLQIQEPSNRQKKQQDQFQNLRPTTQKMNIQN